MPSEEALKERQQEGRQNENNCAVKRSIPGKSQRERAAQGEDENDECQRRCHPVKSLGRTKTWRVGLHVDDVERRKHGEKGKDTPHQPGRIDCLVFENAVDGEPCSDNVSGNVLDQFFEVRICVFGIRRQILLDKEYSEWIPHDVSPVVSD